VANRARFLLEITDAVTSVWGADRVGVHLGPSGKDNDMGDSNPKEIFGHVAQQLGERKVAFLFVRESEADDSLLTHIKDVFGGPVIANEGMTHADAERLLRDGAADAVAFGRDYIATPDLAERLAVGAALNAPDPETFYGEGPEGYTDYPVLAAR
jgi:2,4-dienoyl-CoA reductase-like NADH-dependent reductase (Old Yellow Enzyme family)